MAIFSYGLPAPGGEASAKSWWLYLLLGIVLMIASIIVLGDIALASVISAIFIGWTIIIAGILEIIHAFSMRVWKGFIFDLLLGLLYIAGGAIMLSNPVAASVTLTFVLGIIWIVSGFFRVLLASAVGQEGGSALFLSGIVAVFAGTVILTKWPVSGLWVLGLCVGIDLLFHGFGWISYSFALRSKGDAQRA